MFCRRQCRQLNRPLSLDFVSLTKIQNALGETLQHVVKQFQSLFTKRNSFFLTASDTTGQEGAGFLTSPRYSNMDATTAINFVYNDLYNHNLNENGNERDVQKENDPFWMVLMDRSQLVMTTIGLLANIATSITLIKNAQVNPAFLTKQEILGAYCATNNFRTIHHQSLTLYTVGAICLGLECHLF